MVFEHLFSPCTVGPLALRNRIMLPPHAAVLGDMWGTEAQAEQNLTYWRRRAEDGAAWIDGITGFIENTIVPPGFVPTGTGARVRGVFHRPDFAERAGRYAEAAHAAGAVATCQLVIQGGKPHAPSNKLANYTDNYVPHAMTPSEIAWLIEEYVFAARAVQAAGLDGVELHANHEDLLQLFLSPATNVRDDEYGGDFERRLRVVADILQGIRRATGADFAIGVRFNLDEMFEGGYDADEGLRIAAALVERCSIDYLHGVIGNNWGAPSYLQPHHYGLAAWSGLAQRYREALGIPIVYAGRVTTVAAAERILAAGHADVVGIARANFADGELVSKARTGAAERIRPCIGCNDCLHGRIVESLPFGCSVNPRAGQEHAPLGTAARRRQIMIVGGGPAGLECAVLAAESGHSVQLFERAARLGGQLNYPARLPEHGAYADYIDFQARRLDELAVDVRLGTTVDAATALAADVDTVVIATGAAARTLDVPGSHLPLVLQGRDVLDGLSTPGHRVVVVAQEDHMQPLVIASALAQRGHDVTLVYPTPGIAPLVGKYSIGASLAQLSRLGVRFRVMERVTRIEQGVLEVRNTYSGIAEEVSGFDSVVLACGGVPDDALFRSLEGHVDGLHLIGDAYAPRRLWFATQQAYHLVRTLAAG